MAKARPFTLTASALLSRGPCVVHGVYVQAGTNGTLKLLNDTTAGGATELVPIVTTAGTNLVFEGLYFDKALYATVGGTTSLVVMVEPV